MNSTISMKILIVVYFCIFVMCVFEKNYPRALYWASAAMLTVSIIWGM